MRRHKTRNGKPDERVRTKREKTTKRQSGREKERDVISWWSPPHCSRSFKSRFLRGTHADITQQPLDSSLTAHYSLLVLQCLINHACAVRHYASRRKTEQNNLFSVLKYWWTTHFYSHFLRAVIFCNWHIFNHHTSITTDDYNRCCLYCDYYKVPHNEA